MALHHVVRRDAAAGGSAHGSSGNAAEKRAGDHGPGGSEPASGGDERTPGGDFVACADFGLSADPGGIEGLTGACAISYAHSPDSCGPTNNGVVFARPSGGEFRYAVGIERNAGETRSAVTLQGNQFLRNQARTVERLPGGGSRNHPAAKAASSSSD